MSDTGPAAGGDSRNGAAQARPRKARRKRVCRKCQALAMDLAAARERNRRLEAMLAEALAGDFTLPPGAMPTGPGRDSGAVIQ